MSERQNDRRNRYVEWPHMTTLYNSTNGLNETGKYSEPPLTGYANVFEPPNPYGFFRYYTGQREEFILEPVPSIVQSGGIYSAPPSLKHGEEDRLSSYDSFRRGSTCKVILCLFFVLSFIAVVIAGIVLSVLLSQRILPRTGTKYFESSATINNATFTEELTDVNSPQFQQLAREFCEAIKAMYASSSSPIQHEYDDCEVLEFRSGSVVVKFRIGSKYYSEERFKGRLQKLLSQLKIHFQNMITKKGPWTRLRLDETTIKNFVEVGSHSDSDATQIEKGTRTRTSVQPNIPTDESTRIRAVPEKLLVSSLVSEESMILQPINTDLLERSSIDLRPSILHSRTNDVLLISSYFESVTDSLETHHSTFYKSPINLPSTTFFPKDLDTQTESSATQLLKDPPSFSTTSPRSQFREETKSVSLFTSLTTAVPEYVTAEQTFKRTDLLVSSIVSSEPITSVSSSLHIQHPMSFDKVVRYTSSSLSTTTKIDFDQPQLFSITSEISDKTFHRSPLSSVKSDNEFRSLSLFTSEISTRDMNTLYDTSLSSTDSVILTPEQTVSLIGSTSFGPMMHALSVDSFGNFSTITTSELSASKESDYETFVFDEQSLISESSYNIDSSRVHILSTIAVGNDDTDVDYLSTLSPYASTESTDTLFDIQSVEDLPSKSSIGKYSSEIIKSDTNINTDVIGSSYDVDTDDVITLTQDTMKSDTGDLTDDSFRTDIINLDNMTSLRFKPTRTTQSLTTDTLGTVYITDSQQISPSQTIISEVNYLHSSEEEKSVPVNQTRYIGIPHEISDIDSIKQHNNVTIKSSRENTHFLISLSRISEKSVDIEPMLLSSSKDESYIQSNAPTVVSHDITRSSVSDHQTMSVDSLLYTSYKQEKATTKSFENTEQILSITQPMKIKSVFSSKDEHPSNISEPMQNVFTNVPMERTIDMALDSKYPAHLISEQSVIFEPLHTSMLQQKVDSTLLLNQITTNYVSTELPTEFDLLLTSSSSYQSKVLKLVAQTSIKTHRLVTPSSYFKHTSSSTIQLLATTPSMPTDAKLLSTIDSPLQTEMHANASSSIPVIIAPNGSHSLNVSMSVNIVNITGHFKSRNDTTTGHLESRNITTIEDFEFLNTTKTGDLESHNITTGNIINVDLKLRNITTPTEDLDSQIITTPIGDLDSRNITTPTEDLDSRNITTPIGDLDSRNITTPFGDLDFQNITTPIQDLDSRNITTPTEDLYSRNITTPIGDLDSRNITTPIGDLNSRNITTPIGDLDSRNIITPIGDLDSRNITTPTRDLDSRNITTPIGDLDSRNITTPTEDLDFRNITTPIGDLDSRNITTPIGDLDSRNITTPIVDLNFRNITTPIGDLDSRNITTPIGDLNSRNITTPIGDLDSGNITTPTEDFDSRNITTPIGDLNSRNITTTTDDLDFRNITTPTRDLDSRNITTPIGYLDSRNITTPTEDFDSRNITTSTEDLDSRNTTTPIVNLNFRNITTPIGDLDSRNITTPIGDLNSRNITTPIGDLDSRNITTPIGDLDSRNITTPIGDLDFRNFTTPIGDLDSRNITTPIGDLDSGNITIPTEDFDSRNITTPIGDLNSRNITTTTDDLDFRNITTPTRDLDSRNITTPTGDLDSRNITTPTGDLDSRNITTPIGDLNSRNITTPIGDLDSRNITTPTRDLDSRNITTLTEDLDFRNITTPIGDLDSRNITTPFGDLDFQNITTPIQDLDSRNITTPTEDLYSRNITTPIGDLDSRNITTPIGDLNSRNITTPIGDLDSRNIITPIGDLDSRNSTTPTRDLDSRNITTPIGDLDSRNITTPTEDLDFRNITTPIGDLDSRNITTPIGDFDSRNITTPTGDLDSRNITTPIVDLNFRNITTPIGDLDSRNITTPIGDLNSRNITTPIGDLDSGNITTPTEDFDSRNITTPIGDLNSRNITTTTDDLDFRNITTPTRDLDSRNIPTPIGYLDSRNITTPTEDFDSRNITTSTEDLDSRNTTTPIVNLDFRNFTTPIGDLDSRNITTPIGDLDSGNITIPTEDFDSRNITTPIGDLNSRNITTTTDDLDFRNITTPTRDLDSRNITTPIGNLDSRNITTPTEDLDSRNITTPTGDLDSRNITTPIGDLNSRNITIPIGDLDFRNIITPIGDLDSRNITTPTRDLDSRNITTLTEDLDFRNITTPIGDLDSRNITTPIGDLDSLNITTPTEDFDSRNITTSTGDFDSRNITTPTGDLDSRNITTPIGDLDSRNITTPIGDLDSRNITTPIGDLDFRNFTTPIEDLDSRNITTPIGDLDSGNITTPTEDFHSRNITTPIGDLNSRNITTTTDDLDFRNITTPTRDLDSRNITTPIGDLDSRNITTPTEDLDSRNITTSTEDVDSRNITTPTRDLDSRNITRSENPESRQSITNLLKSRNTTTTGDFESRNIAIPNGDLESRNITNGHLTSQIITSTGDLDSHNITTVYQVSRNVTISSGDLESRQDTTEVLLSQNTTTPTGNLDIENQNITTADNEIQNMITTADSEIQNMTTTADNEIQNMTTTADIKIQNMTTTGDIELQNITTAHIEIQNMTTTADSEIQNMTTTADNEIQNMTTTADIKIQNMTTTGDIELQNITTAHIEIQNMTTIGDIEIQNIKTTADNEIQNITTADNEIQNMTITADNEIQNMTTTADIEIQNMTITGDIELQNITTAHIEIQNMTTIGDIEIQNITTTADNETQNITTTADSEFKNMTTTGDIEIRNITITGDIEIQNMTTADIEIQNMTAIGDIEIRNITTTDDIEIQNIITTGDFIIQNNTTNGELESGNTTRSYQEIINDGFGPSSVLMEQLSSAEPIIFEPLSIEEELPSSNDLNAITPTKISVLGPVIIEPTTAITDTAVSDFSNGISSTLNIVDNTQAPPPLSHFADDFPLLKSLIIEPIESQLEDFDITSATTVSNQTKIDDTQTWTNTYVPENSIVSQTLTLYVSSISPTTFPPLIIDKYVIIEPIDSNVLLYEDTGLNGEIATHLNLDSSFSKIQGDIESSKISGGVIHPTSSTINEERNASELSNNLVTSSAFDSDVLSTIASSLEITGLIPFEQLDDIKLVSQFRHLSSSDGRSKVEILSSFSSDGFNVNQMSSVPTHTEKNLNTYYSSTIISTNKIDDLPYNTLSTDSLKTSNIESILEVTPVIMPIDTVLEKPVLPIESDDISFSILSSELPDATISLNDTQGDTKTEDIETSLTSTALETLRANFATKVDSTSHSMDTSFTISNSPILQKPTVSLENEIHTSYTPLLVTKGTSFDMGSALSYVDNIISGSSEIHLSNSTKLHTTSNILSTSTLQNVDIKSPLTLTPNMDNTETQSKLVEEYESLTSSQTNNLQLNKNTNSLSTTSLENMLPVFTSTKSYEHVPSKFIKASSVRDAQSMAISLYDVQITVGRRDSVQPSIIVSNSDGDGSEDLMTNMSFVRLHNPFVK